MGNWFLGMLSGIIASLIASYLFLKIKSPFPWLRDKIFHFVSSINSEFEKWVFGNLGKSYLKNDKKWHEIVLFCFLNLIFYICVLFRIDSDLVNSGRSYKYGGDLSELLNDDDLLREYIDYQELDRFRGYITETYNSTDPFILMTSFVVVIFLIFVLRHLFYSWYHDDNLKLKMDLLKCQLVRNPSWVKEVEALWVSMESKADYNRVRELIDLAIKETESKLLELREE